MMHDSTELVLAAIEDLLNLVKPYRYDSMELNQAVQELSFLHSTISLNLSLPPDWHHWVERIGRNKAWDRVPGARSNVRKLVGVVSDPDYKPTQRLSKIRKQA